MKKLTNLFIKIFQKVISFKDNLIELSLEDIFREYPTKNLAYVLIDASNSKRERIYLKMKILDKYVEKNININRGDLDKNDFYKSKNITMKVWQIKFNFYVDFASNCILPILISKLDLIK